MTPVGSSLVLKEARRRPLSHR